MRKSILFSMPGNSSLASALTVKLSIELGSFELRDFPDGESYVRVLSDVKDKIVTILCTLDHPNDKVLPLLFLARTLRDLGAHHICLIAAYLPYLRQDKRFKTGEALTSNIFASLLSTAIDSLLTFDPHLHRIHKLLEIYPIQSAISLHANLKIAEWIKNTVASPILIGPDEESEQWVSEIATSIGAPYIIAKKTRYGDKEVMLSLPDFNDDGKVPVLIDDIISTGSSMLALLQQLARKGTKKSFCIAVHALFNQAVHQKLLAAGAERVISCNTITHFSNAIDITALLVEPLKSLYIDYGK